MSTAENTPAHDPNKMTTMRVRVEDLGKLNNFLVANLEGYHMHNLVSSIAYLIENDNSFQSKILECEVRGKVTKIGRPVTVNGTIP